jgi:hypothetical protein
MLVIFHVNVITCQNFNLSHIYRIFIEKKLNFWDEKLQINHMISKHGSNNVTWFNICLIVIRIKNYLN